MRRGWVRFLNTLIRIGTFLLAFALVVLFVIAIDGFVNQQRTYFLRTGEWENLLWISAFGIFMAYVLKKLLVLQWRWGVRR